MKVKGIFIFNAEAKRRRSVRREMGIGETSTE